MTTLIPQYDLKNGGSTPTGAVNRAINLKLSEIVSVKDFGATGNGTTDDLVAFQNAISFCATSGAALFVPAGQYYLTNSITTPDAVSTGNGFIMYGEGLNSQLIFNTTNDCLKITTTGAAYQNYNVQIKDLYFTNRTATPRSFIWNNKPVDSYILGCFFMDATVSTACVINDNAYGLTVEQCTFWRITGTGILLSQVADLSTYSYVNSIINCDFSTLTNGIQVQGCDSLLMQDTVIQECNKAFETMPQTYSTVAFNITFNNCWFERNTVKDIVLGSNSSYWSEAAIRNCQFSGVVNPGGGLYPCTIDLGVKSKVTIEGTPAGNTVTVSGSTDAGAVLIRATNFVQSGSFYWSSLNYKGEMVATTFTSNSGLYAAPPNGTAVTLTTLPNVNVGVWLVTAACPSASAVTYNAVSLVTTQNTTSTVTPLKTASAVTITMSGLNIQATQTTGGVFGIQWAITRIV